MTVGSSADWLAKVRERDPDMDPKRAANVALVEHLDFNVDGSS